MNIHEAENRQIKSFIIAIIKPLHINKLEGPCNYNAISNGTILQETKQRNTVHSHQIEILTDKYSHSVKNQLSCQFTANYKVK